MEDILVYLQDSRVVLAILGVFVAAIVFAIIKKALKFCMIIFICGFVVATVKPTTTQIMANNGISVQGTILTIDTETNQHVIDLSMGTTFDTEEQADGSYIISFAIPNKESIKITVPESTAFWIEFGARLINEFEKTGEDTVHKTLNMIARY